MVMRIRSWEQVDEYRELMGEEPPEGWTCEGCQHEDMQVEDDMWIPGDKCLRCPYCNLHVYMTRSTYLAAARWLAL